MEGTVLFQRSSIDSGRKSVDLYFTSLKKKLFQKQKNPQKVVKFTDPRTLFNKRNDSSKQRCIGSYGIPKLNKDGSWRLGNVCNITPKVSFDIHSIKSYQIIETTKRITKRTKSQNRSYELHVQYGYDEKTKKEKNGIVGIDVGAINMLTIHNGTTKENMLCKLPEGKYRYKNDEIDKLRSQQSKRKKNGRKWGLIQRKIRKLSFQKTNQRRDYLRKATKNNLYTKETIIAENLNPFQMGLKGKGKTTLNRIIKYGGIGETVQYIKHFSKKHNIEYHSVPPHYTSQKCNKCDYTNKNNRNGMKFLCKSCGYETHSDVNASINIHDVAVGNIVNKKKKLSLTVKTINRKNVKVSERTNPKVSLLLEKCMVRQYV